MEFLARGRGYTAENRRSSPPFGLYQRSKEKISRLSLHIDAGLISPYTGFMAVIPNKLKAVLGEDGLQELLLLLEEKTLDGRREILSRLDILEHDLAGVQTESRELRREMNERFDRVNERFDRITERFDRLHVHMGSLIKWTVGTLALFGTLITVPLAIAQLSS